MAIYPLTASFGQSHACIQEWLLIGWLVYTTPLNQWQPKKKESVYIPKQWEKEKQREKGSKMKIIRIK